MDEQDRHDLFSQLVTSHRSQLYAYLFALVRNRDDAEDLFQSVCVILWQKFDSFQPGSSFFLWARQTAIYVVRNAFKRKKLVHASGELLDALAESNFNARSDEMDVYLAALRRCREKLTVEDAHLLDLRYAEGLSTRQIASQLGRPQSGVCNSLIRIRRSLFDCIQMELARRERFGGGDHG